MTDKIICFGKNYHEHMQELGDKPVTKPVIFLKPYSVLKQCNLWQDTLPLKLTAAETHYECEFVIKLRHGGYQLTLQQAHEAIGWYTVGLDMTLRQLQRDLKDAGHPWTIAKVFPAAAVIGPWLENHAQAYQTASFSFSLNNNQVQHAKVTDMMFSPTQLIAYASSFFLLCPGDILFTGTPAGVGKVSAASQGILQLDSYQYQVAWD